MPTLVDLPVEIIRVLCEELRMPAAGLSLQRLSSLDRATHRANHDTLVSLSATCRSLRELVWPYVLAVIEMPLEAGSEQTSRLQLLMDDAACAHVRSLIVGANVRVMDNGDVLNRDEMPGAMFDESTDTISPPACLVLARTAPYLKRLHLYRLTCDEGAYAALASSSSLETLIIEDDFELSKAAGEEAKYDTLQRRSGTAAVTNLRHLSVSTPTEYELERRPDVLAPFLGIASMSKAFEWLCIRTYSSYLGADLLPSSLWASLKVLALDSGNTFDPGFADLFTGFKAYRDAHLSHTLPLSELYLEPRGCPLAMWQHVVECLAGHRLLKLSLCVLPTLTPSFLWDMAKSLPQLQELHLLAFGEHTAKWRSATLSEWAGSVAQFKQLQVFGWNDRRLIALAQLCPLRLETFALYNSFGTTHYTASVWRRIDGSDVFSTQNSDTVTFFPVTPPTELREGR